MRTRHIVPALSLIALTVGAAPTEYIVQPGDTLYGIARSNGIDAGELMRLNGIERPELLLPGTVLSLTDQSTETEAYTVVSGDTLYSIAMAFETTIDSLRRENNLTRDTIVVGQELRIPGRSHSSETDNPVVENAIPLVVAEPIPFDGDGTWPISGEKEELHGKLPGIVIRSNGDSAVQAIAGGRVVYSGPHTSFGNVVFVESPAGFIYVYGGQESVEVGVGQTIEAGSRIGTTREELYFSVWKDNRFVDPAAAPRG